MVGVDGVAGRWRPAVACGGGAGSRSLARRSRAASEDGRDAGHVLVALALDRRRPQRRRRVVHGEDRGVARAGRGIGRSASCRGPARCARPGMNRPIEWRPSVTTTAGSRTSSWRCEVRRAGRDLVGLGVAVAGRPALDDVGDEDVVAPPADVAEQVHEQAAGAADERPALAVLVHGPGPRRRTRPRSTGRPRRGRRSCGSRGAGSACRRGPRPRSPRAPPGARRRSRGAIRPRPVSRPALHPARARRGARRAGRRSSRRPCAGCRSRPRTRGRARHRSTRPGGPARRRSRRCRRPSVASG